MTTVPKESIQKNHHHQVNNEEDNDVVLLTPDLTDIGAPDVCFLYATKSRRRRRPSAQLMIPIQYCSSPFPDYFTLPYILPQYCQQWSGYGFPAGHGQGFPIGHGQGPPAGHGQGFPVCHRQAFSADHVHVFPGGHGQGSPVSHGQGSLGHDSRQSSTHGDTPPEDYDEEDSADAETVVSEPGTAPIITNTEMTRANVSQVDEVEPPGSVNQRGNSTAAGSGPVSSQQMSTLTQTPAILQQSSAVNPLVRVDDQQDSTELLTFLYPSDQGVEDECEGR